MNIEQLLKLNARIADQAGYASEAVHPVAKFATTNCCNERRQIHH
jgi:hypothetical protein